MKRTVCIICLLALLLSACSVEKRNSTVSKGNYSYGVYQLIFKTKLLSNDHVGRDWSFTYTHNGQTIKSGCTITQRLEEFNVQSFGVEIREKDKIDDVGTGILTVTICDGSSGQTKITVTENAGSFKGSSALWEITCQVKLIGRQ